MTTTRTLRPPRTLYRCSECGATHPKWGGRCGTCGEWNALEEDVEAAASVATLAAGLALVPADRPRPIDQVDLRAATPVPTGLPEFDRVLGGGVVPGSVTLVGGAPGIGKSTLLLQLLASWPARSLYVSAEESAQQVRLRAERLRALSPHLFLQAEASLPYVLGAFDEVRPTLVVVDSIQTVADPQLGSAPGSVVQVRGCAHRLVQEAKARQVPVVLVGHITKDGGLAGPRVLEHVVDTVLSFEGDRHHGLRLLRATKHRFGATDELGLFEMQGSGLAAVPDPSQLFLADRRPGVAGSAVTATLEGQRPLLVEVQALTSPARTGVGGPPPRRSAQGIDPGRLATLLAVLEQRAGEAVSGHEVYTSVVGGLRLSEPGVDLAVAVAVASSVRERPLPADLVVIGEVGLGGEIRQVAHTAQRLSEAARLGFHRAVVPAGAPSCGSGPELIRVASLGEALAASGLL